jgi:hypothetical protein
MDKTATSTTLTPKTLAMAIEHVEMLVEAREYPAATAVEVELKDRFVEAVATGTCRNPRDCAKIMRGLKHIEFPRGYKPSIEHKLDVILGH